MNCTQCQATNPVGARFCMNCGAPLARTCPSCSAEAPPQARFCPNCGHQLQGAVAASPQPPVAIAPPKAPAPSPGLHQYIPPELLDKLEYARTHGGMLGERRIVTMLFSDVRGSTAAASTLDPEEWAEIMKGAFEYLIAPVYRYEGTLARLMGDAILAFFGAPIAHEDDPQRAVLAGLEILEGIRPFKERVKQQWGLDFDVRIGINTGLVVVGEVGSDLRLEYTAMGDAINLASRMEQTAQPGTLQVSDNTHRFIAPLFDAEDLGGIEVKGKTEPVRAYRILGAKAMPGQLRGIQGLQSVLVGRDRDLATLKERVEELRRGSGQIVAVMGEAGLGKSRLVAELRRWLSDEGVIASPDVPAAAGLPTINWLEGRSLSYETASPYAPFLDILNQTFALPEEASDEEKYQRILHTLSVVNPGGEHNSAPYLATLLGVKLSGEALERVRYLEPPRLREKVFNAFNDLVKGLATFRPLTLVFEDLHWADATSLDLLEQLLPLTDQVPLMLLPVFRPQRQEPSWRIHEGASRDYFHRYTAIQLEPLGEEDARALVANLLYIEGLPERLRALILQKAEGNPFFVEEVIRSLLDAGAVVRDGAHWRATREIESIAVPDTIAGVLTTRLDRLEEEERRVIQTAAVIGREFQYDILRDTHNQPQDNLELAMADLLRRGLLREKSRIPQRVYSFKHSLIQETAYGSLLLSRRRELHRLVAESIQRLDPRRAGDIGRHYLEAREFVKALPYLVEEGERAAQASSNTEAIFYFRKAVEILETQKDASLARRAYDGLGGAQALSLDVDGAAETFHKMIHEADAYGNLPMKVSAFNKLGRITALMQGQFPEAEKHLMEAERLAIISEDLPGLTELHMSYCAVRTISGEIDDALDHQRRAIEIGNKSNIEDLRLFGASHCANSLTYLTRFDEALPQARHALAEAEKAGNSRFVTEPLIFAIPYCLFTMGDIKGAEEAAQRGTELATHIGAIDNEALGAYTWGLLLRYQGRYEEAMTLFRRALEAARGAGYLFAEAGAICALGSVYAQISQKYLEQAQEHLAQGADLMEHPFGRVMAAQSWTDMGFCLLIQGKLDEADKLFQKALAERTTMRYLLRPAGLVGLAKVSLARGDLAEAARLEEEGRTFARERGMRHFFPLTGLMQATVADARGDAGRALDCLAQAEAEALALQLRPMVLEARAALANRLAIAGRRDQADAKRAEARQTIDEMAHLFQTAELRQAFVEHELSKLGVQAS
ncbi:MAG: AAA family ATPase [Chloroflexi bacterium]|nr:AAA family ATPase [Chloroflexota bacterium]